MTNISPELQTRGIFEKPMPYKRNKTIVLVLIGTAAVVLAAAGIAVSGRLFKYSLIAGGFVFLCLLFWKAFIKNRRDELEGALLREKQMQDRIEDLTDRIHTLDRELSEINRTKLNVVELSPVFHVALMNVDTSFVRTYTREEGKNVFNGALRSSISADYGIRLEEVLFRLDPVANTLQLADFHPGIVSYSRKQLSWDIAVSYRKRGFLGFGFSSVMDSGTELFTKRMTEQLRESLEQEIDSRSISELEWLSPLLTRQVTELLKLLIGRPGLKIEICNDLRGQDGFVSFEVFRKELATPAASSIPAASSPQLPEHNPVAPISTQL